MLLFAPFGYPQGNCSIRGSFHAGQAVLAPCSSQTVPGGSLSACDERTSVPFRNQDQQAAASAAHVLVTCRRMARVHAWNHFSNISWTFLGMYLLRSCLPWSRLVKGWISSGLLVRGTDAAFAPSRQCCLFCCRLGPSTNIAMLRCHSSPSAPRDRQTSREWHIRRFGYKFMSSTMD